MAGAFIPIVDAAAAERNVEGSEAVVGVDTVFAQFTSPALIVLDEVQAFEIELLTSEILPIPHGATHLIVSTVATADVSSSLQVAGIPFGPNTTSPAPGAARAYWTGPFASRSAGQYLEQINGLYVLELAGLQGVWIGNFGSVDPYIIDYQFVIAPAGLLGPRQAPVRNGFTVNPVVTALAYATGDYIGASADVQLDPSAQYTSATAVSVMVEIGATTLVGDFDLILRRWFGAVSAEGDPVDYIGSAEVFEFRAAPTGRQYQTHGDGTTFVGGSVGNLGLVWSAQSWGYFATVAIVARDTFTDVTDVSVTLGVEF